MNNKARIDLLLIGKTGNGKSATGNSIVRKKKFASGPSTSSLTQNIDNAMTEYNGRQINVENGLTICDTRLNDERSVVKLNEATNLALAVNPEGYHAFILVLKYGNRFTREEQETVVLLKKIFGDDFVQKFCILILTCGDVFHQDQEETDSVRLDFSEWCQKQDGAFKDLLEECCHRVILFDNKTKDELQMTEQIDQLIEMIDVLVFRDRRYTEANYKNVQKTKDDITELGQPRITVETVQPAILNVHPPQTTPFSIDTVDVILRNRMLSLTTSGHDTLAKQEEFSGAIVRNMVSLQKKISCAVSQSCIEEIIKHCQSQQEEIKQYRQRDEAMKTNFGIELENPEEKCDNRCEGRDFERDNEKSSGDVNPKKEEESGSKTGRVKVDARRQLLESMRLLQEAMMRLSNMQIIKDQ